MAASCFTLLLAALPARAQTPPPVDDPGFSTNLWTRSTLLGDTGGFRTKLASVGLSVGLQDTTRFSATPLAASTRGPPMTA